MPTPEQLLRAALAVSPGTLIHKSRATGGLMVVVIDWPNAHGERQQTGVLAAGLCPRLAWLPDAAVGAAEFDYVGSKQAQRPVVDYFSRVSASYARFRPTYPSALFDMVARYAPALDCAWDCATGSGQAALGLSRHFREVIATDASSQQVEQATPASNVEYRVAPAEASALDSAS